MLACRAVVRIAVRERGKLERGRASDDYLDKGRTKEEKLSTMSTPILVR